MTKSGAYDETDQEKNEDESPEEQKIDDSDVNIEVWNVIIYDKYHWRNLFYYYNIFLGGTLFIRGIKMRRFIF